MNITNLQHLCSLLFSLSLFFLFEINFAHLKSANLSVFCIRIWSVFFFHFFFKYWCIFSPSFIPSVLRDIDEVHYFRLVLSVILSFEISFDLPNEYVLKKQNWNFLLIIWINHHKRQLVLYIFSVSNSVVYQKFAFDSFLLKSWMKP